MRDLPPCGDALIRLIAACSIEPILPPDVEQALWLVLLELEGARQGCL